MKTNIIIPTVILKADRYVPYRPPDKMPEWAIRFDLPELQSNSLSSVDLGIIGGHLGLFDSQEVVKALCVYRNLKDSGFINRCLNLQDGVSIACYRYCQSVFRGKRVFLWKSVVVDNKKNLFVPFVQGVRDQMPIIYWLWLEYEIDLRHCLGVMI